MTAIKIAFGRGGLSTSDPSWSFNDTSEVGTNGVMYANLLDENGVPTGVSMSCSAALVGQGSSTASTGAGGWPTSVFQRHAFITSGLTRTFTFSGLPPSTSVTLLFAGHRGASATRDSNFTFGGVAGFYDQSGTATPTAPTSVVGVTNGSGVITLVWESNTIPDTAYISAISLTWAATPPDTAKISYYLSDSQGTTATVAFRAIGGGSVALKYSTNSNFSGSTTTSTQTASAATDYLVKFNLTGLAEDTTYYYQAVQNSFDDLSLTAPGAVIPKFKTSKTGQLSFKMALSSCALSESTSRVFDRIRARNPDVFVHHGDLHYADIATNDVALKRAAYLSSLQTKVQNNFFRSCPLWYRYDDHDYGTNNSNSSYVGKVASAATVREIFPQVRAVSSGAIYYVTTRGRVRFIQLDTRYEKNGTAMLGATQKTWFKNELTAAAALIGTGDLGLVIVDTSIPWIASATTDSWSDAAAERTELADHIWSLGLNTNIVFVAGDMHGCAYDDGTNNKYDTLARVGWPIIQSGALDNSGSSKGGPYTSGIFQGGGQYSILDIADNGATIDCSVVAYSSADAALYSAGFTVSTVKQVITSINDGNPITAGQTGIPVVAGNFTAKPTSVTATYASGSKSITATVDSGGSATNFNISIQDRIEAEDWPINGDTITFTFTYGSESASGTQTLVKKATETVLTFSGAITSDPATLTYWLTQDGFTVEGGELAYIPYGDLVLTADGGGSATDAGTFTSWFRPATGTGAGNVYAYTWVVSEAGIQPASGLTSSGLTSSGLTASGLTSIGL